MPGDEIEDGALACAIGSHKTYNLSGLYVEIDPADCYIPTKSLAQSRNFK